MDNHIGDLHSAIVDREIEIIQQLLEEVLVHDKMIGDVCDICAELDCLLSFAEASRNYNYKQPEIVDDNVIEIVGGRLVGTRDVIQKTDIFIRHPLQEQVVDVFVPNDVGIAGGTGVGSPLRNGKGKTLNSVVLCTGANACGKVTMILLNSCES
jgi:DNA mismatch repair protein MSH5